MSASLKWYTEDQCGKPLPDGGVCAKPRGHVDNLAGSAVLRDLEADE